MVSPPISTLERYGKFANVGSVTPPLGLCYIASILEGEGYPVYIIDAEVLKFSMDETVNKILSYDPTIVGITSTMNSFHSAIELGRRIKESNSEIYLVLGGPYVSSLKINALDKTFDFGVYGEGEQTTLELIRYLEHGGYKSKIDGLIYKSKGQFKLNKPREYIDSLDNIPFPARHLLPDLKLYRPNAQSYKKLPATTMITSRGCPYNCIFCDRSTFGNRYRAHSAKYVVDEIQMLIEQFGIKEIWFVDDTFTINKKRVMKICDMLIERNLDISWSCLGRINTVTFEMLKKMKQAGCWMIAYGIETGNQDVMNYIKKGITLEQTEPAIKCTKQAGLLAKGYFMLGHPIDTLKTIDETIDFAVSLPLDYALFLITTPIPNTELFEKCKSVGKLVHTDLSKFSAWDAVYEPPDVSLQQLKDKHREAYRKFYLRPSYIFRQLKNIRNGDDLWRHINAFITILHL